MLVAAPLLVLGRPLVPFLLALPLGWRRVVGHWSKAAPVQFMTRPAVAWSIHAAALWGWHAPPLFEATLRSDLVHTAQHISFLGSALLFWWALFHGRNYGAAVLYVFTTAVHSSVLGALLTFAPSVWYPIYSSRTGAWGLTPLEDQQIGGLIMWAPAGVVLTVLGLIFFALWLRHSEARTAYLGCALLLLATLTGCRQDRRVAQAAAQITGGDPTRGRAAIERRGCPGCHTIPGIQGAVGQVGPPLAGIANRAYVGGVLPNTPDNVVRWVRNARGVDPLTAMPDMGIGESEARDIAAYLYTLR